MDKFLSKIEELESAEKTTVSGLNEGEKVFLPCFLHGKIMIVTQSLQMGERYENALRAFGKRVIFLPKKLPLLVTYNDRTNDDFKRYLSALTLLTKGDFDALVVTSDSLFQRLPKRESLIEKRLLLKKNQVHKLGDLVKKLLEMGYVRRDIIAESGEFAQRADILDVFVADEKMPVRISFFDDEIESINTFDPTTFRVIKREDKVEIFPFSFLNFTEEEKENLSRDVLSDLAKVNLSAEKMLRLTSVANTQLEFLFNNLSLVSNAFFLPFSNNFKETFFDYFKDGTIILDEPKLILDDIKKTETENISQFLELSLKGEFLPKQQEFYESEKSILKKLKNQSSLIAFSRMLSQNKLFESENLVSFTCRHTPRYVGKFLDLVTDIKNLLEQKRTIVICAKNASFRTKLKTLFKEKELPFEEIKNFSLVKKEQVNLLLYDLLYSANFEREDLVVIGLSDLVSHHTLKSEKVEVAKKFLPQVGQYVVHEVHGVGRCLAIENLKITDVFRDYVVLEYSGGDKLYVPSENTDLLFAYSGEESPRLNKIGGAEFYKIKQKVKSSLKEMAFDLIKVYGDRLNIKGFAFSKDSYLQQAFEEAFVFDYTTDQSRALAEIKKDMESKFVMDRLLCGDVGFGKTEVALAAAFKAIQDGKQVALICPTTILCEQHYATSVERMKNFFVRVGVINRFKTKKEQEGILAELKEGKIDLICGTHRLLSDDVVFKDLGLVIVDEEQRFGVEDKEKLKNVKRAVDVLSLSATPIPRTLYMSLSGIRDISFLTSAPLSRKRISTAVVDYSDSLLKEACKRELSRGGQVLIVYNRVDSIGNFYARVKALLPEVNIGLAHGRMNSKMLESAIHDLYSRKTHILISTVLIENGIDLPYANTLFVMDADKLGLSQLYQLRGRIGRSDVEAFAYFSFSKNKILTVDAYKRLDAIMEFSDLGSGYKLALRDLEIRGAGDVLGRSQHGHLQQVGLDLYIKLLNEAMSELRGEKVQVKKDIKLNISLSAYVPEDYIQTSENRILFYTKVSKISSLAELENLKKETESKFGLLPKVVEQLMMVGLIKNLGQESFIKQIELSHFGATVTFYEDVRKEKLFKFLSSLSVDFVLNDSKMPIITLKKESDIEKQQQSLLTFLINCQKAE